MEVGVVSGNTRGWFGPVRALGHQPRGLIIYTPDGYRSAQLSKADRPDFGSGDWFAGTADDYAAEATSYIAYSGPFHVDTRKSKP